MKKGDVVIINDGSYSRSVIGGKLIHEILGKQLQQYIVVEVGCKFPSIDRFQSMCENVSRFNNTVIQVVDSSKIVFIEERFLRLIPPKHKVIIDMICHPGYGVGGKVIEISDELYKKIIEQQIEKYLNDPQSR